MTQIHYDKQSLSLAILQFIFTIVRLFYGKTGLSPNKGGSLNTHVVHQLTYVRTKNCLWALSF
jgi:hypothetical protein